MDHNAIARKLAALGREETAALRMMDRAKLRLEVIAAQRCEFLHTVAKLPDVTLDDETTAYVVRPKED
jgi:acetyl/propionyl-CoA carboxylase alpha subunit